MIATVVLVLRFALAIALYAFLAWALLQIWRDLRQQGAKLSGQKKPGLTITVLSEQGKQKQGRFSQSEIIIGRHRHCDLVIMDEALSAQHARVSYHHGQWWLEDLNSRRPLGGGRVLLIGLDGADWSIVDPLLAAGRMPNLRSLLDRGVRAKLQSISPMISPVVWTTIATGLPP